MIHWLKSDIIYTFELTRVVMTLTATINNYKIIIIWWTIYIYIYTHHIFIISVNDNEPWLKQAATDGALQLQGGCLSRHAEQKSKSHLVNSYMDIEHYHHFRWWISCEQMVLFNLEVFTEWHLHAESFRRGAFLLVGLAGLRTSKNTWISWAFFEEGLQWPCRALGVGTLADACTDTYWRNGYHWIPDTYFIYLWHIFTVVL